jgi:chemotaxis-related protein WspB
MLLIMCHAGADRFAIESRHVYELLPQARLQRPGGSPSWLAGLLVYRGTALSVIDLTRLVHGNPCPNRLSTRIIVLQAELEGKERRFGLLAENVHLCEPHAESEESDSIRGEPTTLGSLCLDAHGVFQLMEPTRLMSQDRQTILCPASEESR